MNGNRAEITIDSDRTTTILLALLFMLCTLLLAREVRNTIYGHLTLPRPLHRNVFGIFTAFSEGMASIYLFLFGFNFPRKSVKLACVLMGADLVCSVALSWLHVSPAIRHTMSVAGSGVRQVALVVFLFTIADWFRTKVRRISSLQTGAEER